MQQFKDIATKILEVTIERNFDVVNKGWENRIFLKLYLSIRTSGLLGAISDKNLKTLITLATFMDAEGKCFPSQECLAKSLNLTQAGVAKRMKSLLAFRWQGRQFVRKSVTQPARRGRPWLRDALTEVAAREGYKVQLPT